MPIDIPLRRAHDPDMGAFMKTRALLFFSVLPMAIPAFGQSVISARSGVVNYFEGDVVLNGERLQRNLGSYTRLKEGSDLVTRSGRAEVLLAPNIYLRIGADSSVRMISDDLSDTRVMLLGGSAIVDSTAAESQNTPVTLLYRDSEMKISKPGQYRIDADPPQFRVFQGSAEVTRDGKTAALASSQLFPLDGAPVVRKFTEGSDNLLDVWSDERHLLIANKMVDAQTIHDPLIDPDPDPNTLAGLGTYLGYLPLSVQSQSTGLYGPTPGGYGVYSGLSYPNPYGSIYGPYLGFYGLMPAIVPGYTSAYRFGTLTLPRPLGVTTTTIPSIRAPLPTRPGTIPLTPRPVGRIGGVGGRR
jgi:hypothetical protein